MSTFSGLGLNTTSASNESNPSSIVDKNNKAFVNLRPTSQQDSSSFFHNTGTDAGKYFSPDENPVFIAGTAHDYTDTDSTTKSTLDKIATGVFSKFQIATADSTNPDNSGYTTNWAFKNDEINNLKITTPINRSIKITNDNLSGSLYTNRLFFGEEESNYNIVTTTGIPAPFPLAIGENLLSKILINFNKLAINIWRSFFSYQILCKIKPNKSLNLLLKKAEKKVTNIT